MSDIGALQGTVLLADDDEAVRDVYAQKLRAHGFHVLLAADGVEAVEILTKLPIDVGLINVMMPRHNGYDVCRIAKSNPQTRSIPIVLITGFSDDADRERGAQAGADDFMSKPIQKDELISRLKTLVKLKRASDQLEHVENVLFTLAQSMEAREPGTQGHCERVARYSAALGQRLGLSVKECNTLRRAGYLHDIGKVSIPDAILLKPGHLNAEELRQMETHPEMGERICSPLQSLKDVLPIIRWHHERLDGGGYPDHLQGKQIPLSVRIVQTVDIYDSLVCADPYRSAFTSEIAFVTIRGEVQQGWWDGSVVDGLEGLFRNSVALPEMRPPLKAWMPQNRRQQVV